MSQHKVKLKAVGPKKSFLISIEESKDGRRFTAIDPRGPIKPQEMLDSMLDALAAIYLNVWAAPQSARVPLLPAEEQDDSITPEEFCQLVATKVLARLSSETKVTESTVQ